MGKTNLLFHAKRTLEDLNNVFVYIDLSNLFPSPRELFRNFIDVAVDSHETQFRCVREEIKKRRRKESSLPPHKEHEHELKILLNSINGKLVFELDEVDALTKTSYSDEIFSQIRSVYFSRINFPESQRLTYILSGVAEPSELIKDKRVSPFNIGEKLFLDDFNSNEFNTFLMQSKLPVSSKVAATIFNWTSGNPRMTWDICSALEDRLIEHSDVTSNKVDELVVKMYLTSYDRPPIDHIRDHVEKDRHVRDAISLLREGNVNSIHDDVKVRMYLYGILSSNIYEVKTIKNKIIDAALNEKWLNDIYMKSSGLIRLADEKLADKEYAEAIGIYCQVLDVAESLSSSQKSSLYYSLAQCYFYSGDYHKAIDVVVKAEFDQYKSPSKFNSALFLLGVSYIKTRSFDKAISVLEEILYPESYPANTIKAKLQIAIALASKDFAKYLQRIHDLVIDVSSCLEEAKRYFEVDEYKEILSTASFYLGRCFETQGDNATAIEEYQKALRYADQITKIQVCERLLPLQIQIETKLPSLLVLMAVLSDETFKLTSQDFITGSPLTIPGFYKILTESYEFDRENTFPFFLDYAEKVVHDGGVNDSGVMYYLAVKFIGEKKPTIGKSILSDLILRLTEEQEEKELVYNCLKTLLIYFSKPENEWVNNFRRYLYYFKLVVPDSIDINDLKILCDGIDYSINNKMYAYAGQLISFTKKYSPSLDLKHSLNLCLVYFMELRLSVNNNGLNKFGLARTFLEFVASFDTTIEDKVLLGDQGLLNMIRYANEVLSSPEPEFDNIIKKLNLSRNDIIEVKYTNGKSLVSKLKKVEPDIRSGLCVFVKKESKAQRLY